VLRSYHYWVFSRITSISIVKKTAILKLWSLPQNINCRKKWPKFPNFKLFLFPTKDKIWKCTALAENLFLYFLLVTSKLSLHVWFCDAILRCIFTLFSCYLKYEISSRVWSKIILYFQEKLIKCENVMQSCITKLLVEMNSFQFWVCWFIHSEEQMKERNFDLKLKINLFIW